MPELWMARLKAAYDAGYYKTEAGEGQQTPIPWHEPPANTGFFSRLRSMWRQSPPRCFQCRRLFSTMTQRVRTRHLVRCWECHRVHVLREPTTMATSRRGL